MNGWPSRSSWRPDGIVTSWIATVRGITSRNVDDVRPPESVTVRWIRYQTFGSVWPTLSAVNDPDVAPLVEGRNGWVWSAW